MKGVVGVVGQGYVGLPLALEISKCGYRVLGIDTNENLVKSLNLGSSKIEDVSDIEISRELRANRYSATSDFAKLSDCTIKIVCVPTPLFNNKPDLSYLIQAVTKVGTYLNEGDLVIIESTIEPETTRKMLIPILVKESNLNSDEFYTAFSPERIDPINSKWGIKNTPKLVAGFNNSSRAKAVEFYSQFVAPIVECSSLEVAETAKLLENSFRLINISFINEISMFCHKVGIEVNEVINAAATKPYGFMPFYPSLGVGGHCIPVDPLYLANKASALGATSRFIGLADEINQEMPGYFVGRAEEKLGELKDKNILIVGVSYKPNIADTRETPATSLISGFIRKGAHVEWHDDLVKEWNGKKSVPLSDNYDLAVIVTPHDYLDLTKLKNIPVLNTREST